MTEIERWLEAQGLGKYRSVMAAHEITIELLPHLTESDLDRLQLPTGARRQLMLGIRALRSGAGEAAAVSGSIPYSANALRTAEWRQLTVLFCDLVGYTILAGRLDAEKLRKLLNSYRSKLRGVIEAYEGVVAQYLGDGIVAYFGSPLAHEDDVERCVRAALDIVREVKGVASDSRLAVHVGIATGMVVVGDLSRWSNDDTDLAVGETPNLAARLQELAGPDEIVIAPLTRQLIGDTFSLTDLGFRTLKGIADPVRAWRVEALRKTDSRFEAAREMVGLTPLVGRQEELALLRRAWQQARDGEGRVILVGGEPGIGKSRLTYELRKTISDEPCTVLRYQCSPYHVNSAFYPIVERIELLAGLAREDSVEQKLDKLEALLAGTPEQAVEAAPLLAALLSLPADRYPGAELSPQRRKERTLEVLVDQIEALSRRQVVLVVFEDVHWIDPTSQEVLDALVPRIQSLRLLLVITHRTDYPPRWADQAHVTFLGLGRLGRRQGAELVSQVTHGKTLPPEVLAQIVDRTSGVPLFVEELTKSVVESGLLNERDNQYTLQRPLPALAIPTTLRDSLRARLDRLAPVKGVIEIGACIGRAFSYELLARVSTLGDAPLNEALSRLTDAGLVYRRGSPPHATYIFKHAMVQEAAYQSLVADQRQPLHARIARVLEEHFGDRAASEPELLAYHYTEAGEISAAIGWWCEAGKLAARRVALQEAASHFQKGLSLLAQAPPSAVHDRLEMAIREPLNAALTAVRGWAAPEVRENAAAILELTTRQSGTQTPGTGLWAIWVNTTTQGRIADSLEWANRLLAEGDRAGDVDLQIFGHGAAMISHFYLGQLLEASQHGDQVLELYDPEQAGRWTQVTAHDLKTLVGVWSCQWTWMLGRPDEAVRLSDEKDAHARSLGDAFNLGFALTLGAYAFDYRCEPAHLLERLDEVERLNRERRVPFMEEVMVPQVEGLAQLRAGHYAKAVASLRRGLDNWQKRNGHSRVPYLKSALAEALARQGDVGAALVLIDECLEQIARDGWKERSHLAEVQRLKGWMLKRLGRGAEAEGALREAIKCAQTQQAKSWELRASTTLAELLVERGQSDAARRVLAPVYDWFKEGRDTHDLMAAHRLLDSLP